MKVNFNVRLGWTNDLHKVKPWKELLLLYFAWGSCHEKVLYKVFTRNILGAIKDHVKVYITFLSLGVLSQ